MSPSATDHARGEQIRRLAYHLYLKRGDAPGSAVEDWLKAEKQVEAARDAMIDEASEESFPASDPPALQSAGPFNGVRASWRADSEMRMFRFR